MNFGIQSGVLTRKLRAVQFVVFDFDGTMTDGFVYLDQDGKESVRCSRKDGLGIEMLKRANLDVMVLSKEANPVVAARCLKLDIPVVQGVNDKGVALKSFFGESLAGVLYMGDDINDLECLKLAGVAVTVADGHPDCKAVADYITSARGGYHAVREVCDLILEAKKKEE